MCRAIARPIFFQSRSCVHFSRIFPESLRQTVVGRIDLPAGQKRGVEISGITAGKVCDMRGVHADLRPLDDFRTLESQRGASVTAENAMLPQYYVGNATECSSSNEFAQGKRRWTDNLSAEDQEGSL